MSGFQDEQGKEVNLSLTPENFEGENEASGCDESVSRMLAAYRQCMNSSDTQSECSEDELEVSDFEDVFEKAVEKTSLLNTLKQKYNDLKDGNFEFDNNFDESIADFPIKPEVNVDFNAMTREQFIEFMSNLEVNVNKKEQEVPSLIAQNVKNHLDKLKESIEEAMNKALNLEFKERVSDSTRLMNVLNLSKSVVDAMKSIEMKAQKANELINTLQLYSNLKEEKK